MAAKGVARNHNEGEVRQALVLLVANQGDAKRTVEQIKEEGLLTEEKAAPITETMIRKWRDDLYSEVYLEIERTYGQKIEDEIVSMMRARARRAAEIEETLMERIVDNTLPRDLPAALRSIADVKAKSVDTLMKLTGRDQKDTSVGSLESLVGSMEGKGYLRVTVDLGAPPEPSVDGTVEPEA